MPPVKLYTLSTCSHCKNTKQFLNNMGVAYDYIDVDLLQGQEQTEIIKEVKKYNPNTSFPTILIGDRIIVGFKEKEIKEVLGL
ncbi:MAG: glutaredoxin family protein [Thermodesulfobacteriota bacterium]|jgi:glutaredoxin